MKITETTDSDSVRSESYYYHIQALRAIGIDTQIKDTQTGKHALVFTLSGVEVLVTDSHGTLPVTPDSVDSWIVWARRPIVVIRHASVDMWATKILIATRVG